MKLGTAIFALCGSLLFAAGNATAQWVVVEDFQSGMPAWNSFEDLGGGAWEIRTAPGPTQSLYHDVISSGTVPGIAYVVCKLYPVVGDVTGQVRIRNLGGILANGYGTMACVVLEGSHTTSDLVTDYLDGSFDIWKVVGDTNNVHTVGTWDGTWHDTPGVTVDTTGVDTLSVCFAAVAALGTSPEAYYDDLQFSLSLVLEVSGIECWELYE